MNAFDNQNTMQTPRQTTPSEGVPPSNSPQGSPAGMGEGGESMIDKLERVRFIPSRHLRVLEDDATGAVVYAHEPTDGFVTVIAYTGRKTKHDFYCSFRSMQRAREYWEDWYAKIKSNLEHKAMRKAEKAEKLAQPHGLKVGDVLAASWGYEQTNVNYYEVTALRGRRSVEVREIGQKLTQSGFMSGYCTPEKGAYIGEPMVKRVTENDSIKVQDWGVWARKQTPQIVDGVEIYRELSCSWYA